MYHIIPHFDSLLIGYGWLYIHIHLRLSLLLTFFSLFNLFECGMSVLPFERRDEKRWKNVVFKG
jgi:hypothetical protein